MMPEARFESLEDLKEEFFRAGRPWWKVYEGKKRPTGSRAASVYAANEDTPDLEEAWESLLEALQRPLMRGKKMGVSLFSMKSSTAKGQNDKYPIDVDIILPQMWLAKNTGSMNIMGMGAMGQPQQVPMGFIHKDDVSKEIERALEKERTAREIKELKEQLEAAQNESQSFGSKGLDYLAGVLEEPLREVGMAASGYVKAATAAKFRETKPQGMGMTGIQGGAEYVEEPAPQQPEKQAAPDDVQRERLKRWQEAINRFSLIAKHHSRDPLADFEMFQKWLEQDENNYIMLLNFMPK